jgi:hypothetical protein
VFGPEHITFRYTDEAQLERVRRVIDALSDAKKTGEFRDDGHWLAFFDEPARAHFRWSTESEDDEWRRRWFDTPVSQRMGDPSLQRGWDFASLVEAFRNGDYDLGPVQPQEPGIAVLQFRPGGYPFGGTEHMTVLLAAFGCRVVRDSTVP